MIIKTLIKIRETFIDGDCRYILNDLYINDYCVWIQYVRYFNFNYLNCIFNYKLIILTVIVKKK